MASTIKCCVGLTMALMLELAVICGLVCASQASASVVKDPTELMAVDVPVSEEMAKAAEAEAKAIKAAKQAKAAEAKEAEAVDAAEPTEVEVTGLAEAETVEAESTPSLTTEPVAEDYETAEESAENAAGDGYVDANESGAWYSGDQFAFDGTYSDASGYSYTYYSENVLAGGGLDIPGRHVGDEGYIYDADGNVCLASDNLAYGTVVNIPFGSGTGVVYDEGSGDRNLDVYVSW